MERTLFHLSTLPLNRLAPNNRLVQSKEDHQARFDYFNEEVTWTAIEAVDQDPEAMTWAARRVAWAEAQAPLVAAQVAAAWAVPQGEAQAVAPVAWDQVAVAHPVAWEALQEVPPAEVWAAV